MNDLVGCILIAILGTMAWAFATLAADKKKGDHQILSQLHKENSELWELNAELMHSLEEEKLRSQAARELFKIASTKIDGFLGVLKEEKPTLTLYK